MIRIICLLSTAGDLASRFFVHPAEVCGWLRKINLEFKFQLAYRPRYLYVTSLAIILSVLTSALHKTSWNCFTMQQWSKKACLNRRAGPTNYYLSVGDVQVIKNVLLGRMCMQQLPESVPLVWSAAEWSSQLRQGM
jgi:hypothetical protein